MAKRRPDSVPKSLIPKFGPEPFLKLFPSFVWKGARFRVVWNTVIPRSLDETFHIFLVAYLKSTFGQVFADQQKDKLSENRHVVFRWIVAFSDFIREKTVTQNRTGSNYFAATMTGEVKALLVFAYALYCLQVRHKLPLRLLKRLRHDVEFQGAFYEVVSAAICTRAGFEVNYDPPKNLKGRSPEFTILHEEFSGPIAVEVKSRRRRGILNESGPATAESSGAGLVRLLHEAFEQRVEGLPFIVFVDMNLPPATGDARNAPRLMLELKALMDALPPEDADKFDCLVLTNFAFHYLEKQEVPPLHEHFLFVPASRRVLPDQLINKLSVTIEQYAQVPRDL